MENLRPVTSTSADSLDSNSLLAYVRSDSNERGNSYYLQSNVLSDLTDRILTFSPIKAMSKVTYITSDRLELAIDKDASRQGGWVRDDKIEDAEKTISRISIELHELYARPMVTQKLIDDASVNVEDFIKEKIVSQMGYAENRAFIHGDGIGQPKGILSYGISGKQEYGKLESVQTGKDGEIETYEPLLNLMGKLESRYLPGAKWIMSRSAAAAIRLLKDPSTNRFIWQNGNAEYCDTLFGYPVITCDDMPDLVAGTGSTPVMFANLYEGYHVAENPNIKLLKDPYNSKPFVEFYATKRIGGDVINFDAIKLLNCRPSAA